jgi:lipopolysaccharide transport system permease protein
LLALPVLLVVLLWNGINISGTILLLPLIVAVQFTLILGLAYFAATLHVAFRDTQYLLGVALQLLFFLSPVFYDAKAIPERFQLLYHFNPMVSLIDAYRSVLLRGQVPEERTLLLLGVISLAFALTGYFIFTRAGQHFVDEL